MRKSCLLIALFMLLMMIHTSLCLTKCKKHELEALIKFKHSFTEDPQRLLSSWVGDDCCHWHGVSCDDVTGNVIKLNLRNSLGYYVYNRTNSDHTNSLVSSELSSALLELTHLSHLDLSWNNFTRSRIPEFVGSMTKLKYLNFSTSNFFGPIPPQIGNLTNLIHLDLSDVGSYGRYMLYTKGRLDWTSGLSKLQYLDMTQIDMSQAYETLQVLFRLPSLLVLSLMGCSLPSTHLSELLSTNTSTLQHLDLSSNNFEGPFPSLLSNMTHLEYLNLQVNRLHGSLACQFWQLKNLNYLDLSYNRFQGRIPGCLAKLYSLKYLELSYNEFSGLIQDTFEHLSHLTEMEHLGIAGNSFQGSVSHIGNLSKLSHLDMNLNDIILNMSTNWRPPFQLQFFGACSCEINMPFPQWLRNQTQIDNFDLANTGISGELPQWLWNMTTLHFVQLTDNKITGSLPRHITCDGCNLEWLDLHHNMLSGTIPHWLKHLRTIRVLDLSQNSLSGRIFEGENASSLLSGRKSLELLDLSDNMLSGEIQVTNARRGTYLVFLSLRGNDFSGLISSQFCHFTNLAVLDLAHNRLTGQIPRCLGSLIFDNDRYEVNAAHLIAIQENIKGTIEYLSGTLNSHSMIDLSCNHLVGAIPEELTSISKLMQLNLSNNHLTGGIPDDIGNLQLLESLDLSNNNLSGTIPHSLSHIPWLSVLNLSYNSLHGPIPTGNQLQTLVNPSIYAGNSGLCGFPLPKKCPKPNPPPNPTDDDPVAEKNDSVKDKLDQLWLYLAVMSGVATGFWGVVLTLVFKKSWRHAYFRFVEKTADRIYVSFKVRMNRFRRTNKKQRILARDELL